MIEAFGMSKYDNGDQVALFYAVSEVTSMSGDVIECLRSRTRPNQRSVCSTGLVAVTNSGPP